MTDDTRPRALLITGGRDRISPLLVDVIAWLRNKRDILLVGDCKTGIDKQATIEGRAIGVDVQPYVAAWDVHGLAAGPLRNGRMVRMLLYYQNQGYETAVVAFPSGGPGTADCIEQAQAAGFEVGIL